MALIKKAKPADAIEEDEADASPDEEPVGEPTGEEPTVDAEEAADADAATMGALAAVPADPVETDGAGGADSLLDMFTTVGIERVDRTVLVGLAGEVLIEDLISELNLVAAALGVVRAQHEARAEDEQLAA